MGTGLLLVAGFQARTIMPVSDVTYLETAFPGWLQTRLDEETSYIEARLRKRYITPLDRGNPPYIALRWLTDIVTQDAFSKRGRNPTSEQDQVAIDGPADRARAELLEAANSEVGLFDLPTIETLPGASGIAQGGPRSYSEQSPYAWTDRQLDAVRGGGGRGGSRVL